VENYVNEVPNQSELEEWASEYAQQFPVLSDSDWAVTERFVDRPGHPSLPRGTLLGPGAVVLGNGEITEQDILDALQ